MSPATALALLMIRKSLMESREAAKAEGIDPQKEAREMAKRLNWTGERPTRPIERL